MKKKNIICTVFVFFTYQIMEGWSSIFLDSRTRKESGQVAYHANIRWAWPRLKLRIQPQSRVGWFTSCLSQEKKRGLKKWKYISSRERSETSKNIRRNKLIYFEEDFPSCSFKCKFRLRVKVLILLFRSKNSKHDTHTLTCTHPHKCENSGAALRNEIIRLEEA